jgi:hypothetical protein
MDLFIIRQPLTHALIEDETRNSLQIKKKLYLNIGRIPFFLSFGTLEPQQDDPVPVMMTLKLYERR